MSESNGGPAFLVDQIIERDEKGHMHGHEISSAGISVRDYFAAKAMAAIIRGANGMTLGADHEGNNLTISNVAYSMADAMLAIRKGGAS